MNSDIIPITYAGGTGGNFLCHFIVAAKYAGVKKYKLPLSNLGNAHSSPGKDVSGAPYPMHISDDLKIKHLLSVVPEPDKVKPYYTIAHIEDIQVLVDNFSKAIRIIFDESDFDELTNVFLGKYITDCLNIEPKHLHLHAPSMRFFYIKHSKSFKYEENRDSILFITWKELYHTDPLILITKLSEFTGIPTENFSLSDIADWRNTTKFCIESVVKILSDNP